MENILIKNATIIDSGKKTEADILIKNGIIEKIDSTISLQPNTRLILADNKHLIPGVIDTHVHFRDPGMSEKATFATESAAAAAGGVTTVIDMPNTKPAATTLDILEKKYEIARNTSAVNYSFMIGANDSNIDDIQRLDPKRVAAVKIFLGSSTGNMAVKNIASIERLFAFSPIMIAAHCEDDERIKANMAAAIERYADDIPAEAHAQIRDREACYNSSRFAVELAKKAGGKLHLLHISTEEELSLIDEAPYHAGKKITGEACTHHLFFSEEDYATKGNLIKVNPSVKSATDKEALWKALCSGRIDTVATDHAPHTWEEKNQKYTSCPSGGPMIQHSLPAMLSMVSRGVISLEDVVEKMCHNPARIFEMQGRGFLREGYHADMVLIEMNSPWRMHRDSLLYKCAWSAFDGMMFSSRVDTTIVGGQVAYANGRIHKHSGAKEIVFER